GRDRALAESTEQQAALTEVLRVIASSPSDLALTVGAVVETAVRLCGADAGALWQVEGENLRSLYRRGRGVVGNTCRPRTVARNRQLMMGRAIVDRRPVHVHDIMAESDEEYGASKEVRAETGYRTGLAVPLLLENVAIGAMALVRMDVRPFGDREIA